MKKNTTTSKDPNTLLPDQWSDSYFDYLLNFARGRMPDEELARDIVQQTFMAAWKGRDSFRGDSTERTWLTTILRNKITDFYRARSRRPQLVEMSVLKDRENENVSWIEERITAQRDEEPDQVVERTEFISQVLNALNDLPAAAGQALRMRAIDGTSVTEIAAALGLSAGSVSTKICRARQRLRTEFAA